MAEAITSPVTKRCAIVTGANKGIGFEICRQLAADHGIMVVLTARDEKRGLEAIEKLRGFGLSADRVLFHQLDVSDPTSVASLVDFIKTRFGKLDILINNAGISGVVVEGDVFILAWLIEKTACRAFGISVEENHTRKGNVIQTYELAEECLQINYNGAKRMIEAFIPLLQLSHSPRIVNVSSTLGNLKLLNEWAIGVLSDVQSLTEERVDEVLNEFLKDFKEGSLQAKDWPLDLSAYVLSKAALNAYTRIIAKRYSNFIVNCVCPGFVKTDITENTGVQSVEEGATSPVKLALLPDGGPSGLFFRRQEASAF